MSGWPVELIFLLAVGFFWLAQFVRQQRRRQAPDATDAEDVAEALAAAEAAARSEVRPPALVSEPAEGLRRSPPPKDRQVPASSAPAPAGARRYSRRALMGNRRAVQNAMVTAVILQPCRAYKPHEAD